MTDTTKTTLSARLDPNTRELAQAAAMLQGITLSRFAARAIEQAARREILEGGAEDHDRQARGLEAHPPR